MTSFSNPVGPARILPPPVMQQPMMPFTIKIDIVPNYPMQVAPQANEGVIYNIPQTSLYEPKLQEQSESAKKTDKTDNKKDEKSTEATLAKVLAAQNGINTTKTEAKAEDKKEVKHNKPEIVKPEVMKTGIDLDGLMTILDSPDYEEQADAMEAMAEVTLYAPERAGELLDSSVVDKLSEIMTKDTSKLQGKDKKLADRNKEYAMFTTATLQKMFANEVKRIGNTDVPAKDLIGIEPIVKNLATNPNESIREAAVASIGYVANQSNKNEMTKVLNAAAGDVSAVVRAQANKQLAKITA